jgi:dipeptidyl aminopeptidase/acylaminoacyl peptidase
MKNFKLLYAIVIIVIVLVSCNSEPDLGIFEGSGDIGNVGYPGKVVFNASDSSYAVSGGGTNMWFDSDQLHYAWKKDSGDISISADIAWVGEGLDAHRKACLIIRQDLDTASVYVDVAVHGDGLTSIQYRGKRGDMTREVQSSISSPRRVQIEKRGDYYSMSVAVADGPLQYAGGTFKLSMSEPFYIGLGVSAHNNDTIETAIFSNVKIEKLMPKPDSILKIQSTLETISIASFDRRVVYNTDTHIEAPNWTPDGNYLIYNSGGLLYKIPGAGGVPELIPTGFARRINNDHGISPDGTRLVISDGTETGRSMIYTLPVEGGDPEKVTPLSPSYWHGWSPDGLTLTYCAERNGNYDVYTIPVGGGKEKRLTTAEGLDDGPEYSPDGKYIYFNSVRTGTMQIWRMKPDGSDQEQITTDKYNDWFAHPSPDGKWIVYVTFGTDVPAGSHPPNKDVMLRIMNLETKEVRVMAELFGGQGTINVPSWSPDSEHVAFVSYRLN